jgi:NAD(P)-dependent dehydrogenase (short-subunit alcohol dehydrogenase family)
LNPGGASGIGLAIVKFFASQHSTVAVLDINEASGADLVNSLAADFPKASISYKKCDISSWDDQKSAFEQIYKENGRIDVVIPNAGITEKGSFIPKNDGEPQKPNLTTLDVNLVGTLYSEFPAFNLFQKHYLISSSSSNKLGHSLHVQECRGPERLHRLHRFKCRAISSPHCANVCCFKIWGRGYSKITSKTSSTGRDSDQRACSSGHR